MDATKRGMKRMIHLSILYPNTCPSACSVPIRGLTPLIQDHSEGVAMATKKKAKKAAKKAAKKTSKKPAPKKAAAAPAKKAANGPLKKIAAAVRKAAKKIGIGR